MVTLPSPVDVKSENIEDGVYRGTIVDYETDKRDIAEVSLEEYETSAFESLLESARSPGPVTDSPWEYVGYVYIGTEHLPVERANTGMQFRVFVENQQVVEVEKTDG